MNKEINAIEKELDSGSEERINKCHEAHIERFIKGTEELWKIDLKIEEYTKNAISNNNTEIVMENIELLVDAENYDTFFNLLEELFEWDEKYACKELVLISQKNRAWLIKDKMIFFKQYALQKLISQSGKLDAIQNLLLIYDYTNLGMRKLSADIAAIIKKHKEIKKQTIALESKSVKDEETELGKDILERLKKATTKDLRSYYIPIQEAYQAYGEGKYDIVNKYLRLILTDFEQDCFIIKSESKMMEVDVPIEYTFSYVTAEEICIIDQLIERDKENMNIPEPIKKRLLGLQRVVLNNRLWGEINVDTLEIFRSTFDLPRG